VNHIPSTTTDYAFYISSANLTSFIITNPAGNASTIAVEYSIAQYQSA